MRRLYSAANTFNGAEFYNIFRRTCRLRRTMSRWWSSLTNPSLSGMLGSDWAYAVFRRMICGKYFLFLAQWLISPFFAMLYRGKAVEQHLIPNARWLNVLSVEKIASSSLIRWNVALYRVVVYAWSITSAASSQVTYWRGRIKWWSGKREVG